MMRFIYFLHKRKCLFKQFRIFVLFSLNFPSFLIISIVVWCSLLGSEHRTPNIFHANDKMNENNVKFNVKTCICTAVLLCLKIFRLVKVNLNSFFFSAIYR